MLTWKETQFTGKQRKSPENGDWKINLFICITSIIAEETKKISWKWRLKVTFSFVFHALSSNLKQRKSPENGDWKSNPTLSAGTFTNTRNKENLLKMEIESDDAEFVVCSVVSNETKKISWKWRLKDYTVVSDEFGVWLWNKENLLKMEIESLIISVLGKSPLPSLRNKENLLKMEIERCLLRSPFWFCCSSETKKISWKWRLKAKELGLPFLRLRTGNKENLLKMEIERRPTSQWKHVGYAWNKENLLKMEIESSVWRCGNRQRSNVGETKKISWKWRLKEPLNSHPLERVKCRNKENLLKMEIESWIVCKVQIHLCSMKQRKSPENGDWK